jgi:acyl-CoA reductase-like NAD-dependent aldehyde dehydrogenase
MHKLALEFARRGQWRWADLVEKNAAEIAMLETLDVGKPYAAAMRLDINEAPERLRYCDSAAMQARVIQGGRRRRSLHADENGRRRSLSLARHGAG